VLLYKALHERDNDTMWVPLLKVSFFSRCHTVSLLSSIFILVFSSIKFDIGFIDKNYLLTILESMPIKIFLRVKIVTSRAIALYGSCGSIRDDLQLLSRARVLAPLGPGSDSQHR
jgi:hypothetical protein